MVSGFPFCLFINFFLNPGAFIHYFFQIVDNGRRVTFVVLHPFNDFPDLRYNLRQFLFPGFLLLEGPHFIRNIQGLSLCGLHELVDLFTANDTPMYAFMDKYRLFVYFYILDQHITVDQLFRHFNSGSPFVHFIERMHSFNSATENSLDPTLHNSQKPENVLINLFFVS